MRHIIKNNVNDMNIIINSIDYKGSIVDGPGIRTVLYLQGCDLRCDGCHNPSTWDIENGKKVEIDILVKELLNKSLTKKITISGGEPLLQASSVIKLTKLLKSNNFNIVLYTGHELEEVPGELLNYLDYIKVGRYDKNNRSTTVDFIGSTNQRFIALERNKHEE